MYELLTDISGFAKKGSASDLKKFSEKEIAEWLRIGVVKKLDFNIANETIIPDKVRNPQLINRFETPELIELRKKADDLGIVYQQDAGENKLNFLIKEAKKNNPLIKRGRPKKEEKINE